MKIDESSINHNAIRVINEIIGIPYEYCEKSNNDSDGMRLLSLGGIYGVIMLADELKKLLKD